MTEFLGIVRFGVQDLCHRLYGPAATKLVSNLALQKGFAMHHDIMLILVYAQYALHGELRAMRRMRRRYAS